MKQNMTKPGLEGRHGSPQGPARNWVLILTLIIGLGVVALLIVTAQRRGANSKDHSVRFDLEEKAVPEMSGTISVAAGRVPASHGFIRVPSRAAPAIAATPSESEASASARQLVKSLSEVNLPGALTPEKAEQWQRNLEGLIQQGTAAVPVLREFFQRNEDLRFDAGPGTNLLGEPALRIAFLKVLFDIPAPENVELQEQVLRSTLDPDEIALLARQLDLQEPGKHRELIVQAAKAALELARNGQLPGRDTRPLIEVLKRFEDADAK